LKKGWFFARLTGYYYEITIAMKFFTADYFEKKFRILYSKLLFKEGLKETAKEVRRELGLPPEGFKNESELAIFLMGKMANEEIELLNMMVFVNDYSAKNELPYNDENIEKFKEAYYNEYLPNTKPEEILMGAVSAFGKDLIDHNNMLTMYPFPKSNKYFSSLFPITLKFIRKFWGLDLLDEHIMGHLAEKYLFLGEYGVNQYIKSKIACTNCRYIGVNHFSPNRNNMEGQDTGPYSKGYIFNKETVKQLSLHFNSVFLIIKPYATKEEVLNYVEDNWDSLKKHVIEKNTFYKQYGVHPSKIKESDFERNRLIYELNKLSKKDLLKRYKGERDLSLKNIYKETIIAAILKEEYNASISPEAVKKAAARFDKTSRIKMLPKDIRDI